MEIFLAATGLFFLGFVAGLAIGMWESVQRDWEDRNH
jgi:hypothetical protein